MTSIGNCSRSTLASAVVVDTPAQSAPGEPYTGPPLGKDFGQFREQLSKVLLWWAFFCTAASDGTVHGAHRPIVGASRIGTRIRVAQQMPMASIAIVSVCVSCDRGGNV